MGPLGPTAVSVFVERDSGSHERTAIGCLKGCRGEAGRERGR